MIVAPVTLSTDKLWCLTISSGINCTGATPPVVTTFPSLSTSSPPIPGVSACEVTLTDLISFSVTSTSTVTSSFIPAAEAVYVPAFILVEVVVSVVLLQPTNDPAKTRATKEILNFFIIIFPPCIDFMIDYFFTNEYPIQRKSVFFYYRVIIFYFLTVFYF